MDDRDGSRPSFKLSDRGLPFLQSGGVAGPDKKAYLKSRNNDQAIVVVLHSSVSIQFSAPTCRTHTYLCRHISTPSKFGVILCLCGAVERENFFWSREFGHVRKHLARSVPHCEAFSVIVCHGLGFAWHNFSGFSGPLKSYQRLVPLF